ncbi:MAG TPA: cytochrome c [Stellaceae bacterium]|nr:cytochrome c [Stellaceae bacterium]
MTHETARATVRALAAMIVATLLSRGEASAADQAQLQRGEVLFKAADCTACHTDVKGGGQPLAGGRPLATPFGTFFSPNITSDKRDGIGAWSEAEFRRALREGEGRHGEYLFPVFPYPSFTGMTDEDIAALYAYLEAQPAVTQANKPHAVSFPFSWRFLQIGWRLLFFSEGPLKPAAGQTAEWNRGRYLAETVVHCQECHTPRNLMGGLKRSQGYSGNPQGPDGQKTPNITADAQTGIGKWQPDDIATLLKTGQTPDFDFVGSGMADVVKGTAALSDEDRHAIAVYIRSLPPIHTEKKPES